MATAGQENRTDFAANQQNSTVTPKKQDGRIGGFNFYAAGEKDDKDQDDDQQGGNIFNFYDNSSNEPTSKANMPKNKRGQAGMA